MDDINQPLAVLGCNYAVDTCNGLDLACMAAAFEVCAIAAEAKRPVSY